MLARNLIKLFYMLMTFYYLCLTLMYQFTTWYKTSLNFMLSLDTNYFFQIWCYASSSIPFSFHLKGKGIHMSSTRCSKPISVLYLIKSNRNILSIGTFSWYPSEANFYFWKWTFSLVCFTQWELFPFYLTIELLKR